MDDLPRRGNEKHAVRFRANIFYRPKSPGIGNDAHDVVDHERDVPAEVHRRPESFPADGIAARGFG